MTTKLDCVEMKHKGAEILQKKIAGLTISDELKFWNEQTSALQARREQRLKKKDTSSPHTV